MSIRHHPTDETLVRYAAGTLPAGPSIVVATHIDGCSACGEGIADFEAVGGAIVEDLSVTAMVPEALARALAVIDAPDPAPRSIQTLAPPLLPNGLELPAPLRGCQIGRWQWLAPGISKSRIAVPHDPKANVVLLRVGPNKQLFAHGHTGLEFTQVISGSFSDGRGRYAPGDLTEVDTDVDHQLIVDSDSDCICLITIDGRMRFHNVIGWLMQPFIGF